MSLIKRLFPASAKDRAKGAINLALSPLGWRLAPVASVVTDGAWYNSPVDGVVSRHRSPSLDDESFQAAIQHLAKHRAFNELDDAVDGRVVMYRLYLAGQLASVASAIDGDFVEFGTYRGATAYCMLNATARQSKPMYLYDTFAGIPDHAATDREKEVGLVGEFQGTSVEIVESNLREFRDRLTIRQGLIPETLSLNGPEKIAMMHVDLNLASPTIDALTWAFPKWSRGGICLLDDYLWDGYEDQRKAVENFFCEKQLPIVALPTGQGVVFNL